MDIFDKALYYLILTYIVVLPIFPSKYKLKGIPLNGDIVLGIIIIFYLTNLVLNKEVRQRFFSGIKNIFNDFVAVFSILLFLVMLISATYSLSKSISLSETVRFGTYIALYFIIKLEIRDKAIKNLLACFLMISVVVSLIGLLGIPLNYGVEKQTSSYGMIIRIESTLENSNNFGAFLILSVFPFITLALNEKKTNKKIVLSLGALVIFMNIIFTQSRGAWLAFIFGCICYIVIYNWKSIIFFSLGFIGMLFIPTIRDRVMQINDPTQNSSRIKLWGIAIKMIKDHPLLGVGNGNYPSYYSKYEAEFSSISYNAHGQFHPHNIFLKIQSELGVAGLLSFIGFILSIFFKFNKVVKSSSDKFYKSFYKGFVISFLAFMMMNLLDNFFSAPKVIAFLWVIIAISQAVIDNIKVKA